MEEKPISELLFEVHSVHAAVSQELEEVAVTFALEALDAQERDAYLLHIEGCQVCRALAGEYRAVAAVLPELVAEEAPSPGLKERILAQAKAEMDPRQAPPDEARAVSGGKRGMPWWRRRWLAPLPVGATAAALAVIALASWNIVLQQQMDTQQSVINAGDVTMAEQKRVLASLDQELEARVQAIGFQSEAMAEQEQVLDALVEGARVWPMSSMSENHKDARAAVVQYNGERMVLLLVKDLPALPSGRIYQVWRMMEDKTDSPGFIPEGTDGFQTVMLETDFTDAEAGGISVEPEGGSSRPTLMVLFGRYRR